MNHIEKEKEKSDAKIVAEKTARAAATWNASPPWPGEWTFTAEDPRTKEVITLKGSGRSVAEAWEHACLQMWRFSVTHPTTKEVVTYMGQGTTMLAAGVDGTKGINATFQPKSNGASGRPGAPNGPILLKATRPDGTYSFKSLKQFEEGIAGDNDVAPRVPPRAAQPAVAIEEDAVDL